MKMTLYLEHYLSTVQHLPEELKRNFELIRDLDNKVHVLMKRIDQRSDVYLTNIKVLSPAHKKQHLNEIQNLFNKAKEYGNDKVQLAIDSYELVDKHICRLDADLVKFDAAKARMKNRKPPRRKKKKKKRVLSSSDEDSDVGQGKKKKRGTSWSKAGQASEGESDDEGMYVPNLSGIAHTSDLYDMPVDPNEPTYCLCHQVSYGEMIGCDNTECAIEWFHFPCVGLTTKPMGEWYCPKCTAERK